MFMKGTELGEVGLITPAGVPAVHEGRLAGVGQWEELVSDLPALIKSGGDVAANIYRAVNYSPTVYPTGYTSPYMTGGVATGPLGLGSGTLLLLGGGLLLFMMMRR